MNRTKKLPVGIENFSKLRTEDFYYVDKTAMIRELLNSWGEVNMFTRPRRFGKSLNMSMLKAFFEIGTDRSLFDGLEISQDISLCEKYMGKFPVISLSLKGADAGDFMTSRGLIIRAVNEEAERLNFLRDSTALSASEKKAYAKLLDTDMDDETLYCSLRTLSRFLWKHYGEKAIILIDEYDVPLAKASERGYYDQMVDVLRNLLGQVLKTNDSLYFAVLTGCLRVAKESIFTGLNNLKVLSITSAMFDEYFGFTDMEVRELLEYYSLMEKYDAVREWYDGYRFGNMDVYCPWDVISYCDELAADISAYPREYWSNTSGNDMVRHIIEKSDVGSTEDEIESLIAGETVTKEIREELTYNQLHDSIDNVWSVLFMTGYLTHCGKPNGKRYELRIPNKEIHNLFVEQISKLFREKVEKDGERLSDFCYALQSGNAAEAEKIFTLYLQKTITIRDTSVPKPRKENFYHGILLGILGFKSGWKVKSNTENGMGYSDILIRISSEDIGIVIEVKYAEKGGYESALKEAFEQIGDKDYTEKLMDEGFQTIYKYGVACFMKKCRIRCEKAT